MSESPDATACSSSTTSRTSSTWSRPAFPGLRDRVGRHNGALGVLHGIDATPPRGLELAVLVLGSALATVTRYIALNTWVFARRHRVATLVAEEGPGR